MQRYDTNYYDFYTDEDGAYVLYADAQAEIEAKDHAYAELMEQAIWFAVAIRTMDIMQSRPDPDDVLARATAFLNSPAVCAWRERT